MKKIIALLLLSVMCLSLVACKNVETHDKVVGTWVNLDETFNGESYTVTFNSDGSAKISIFSTDYTWRYDTDHNRYILSGHMDFNISFETVDGIEYMHLEGDKWVRMEDYDKVKQYCSVYTHKEEAESKAYN